MKAWKYLSVIVNVCDIIVRYVHKKQRLLLSIQNLTFLLIVSVISLNYRSAQAAEVSIAWDSSNYAGGYKLYYGMESGNYPFVVDVGLWTQCNISNLDHGQTYYVAVTAYNEFGESDFSEEIYFTIDLCHNDFNIDGDIDGSDLTDLIKDLTATNISDFAARFGTENCER